MKLLANRRKFLSALGGAIGLCAGGWWLARRLNPSPPEDFSSPVVELIAGILQRRLPFLKLDGKGINAFAGDLQARNPAVLRQAGQGRTEAQDWLTERYLLSSDFFHYEADESRSVNYMAYYDPYARPCGNPFAQF